MNVLKNRKNKRNCKKWIEEDGKDDYGGNR